MARPRKADTSRKNQRGMTELYLATTVAEQLVPCREERSKDQ